jgi:hypothetical protein
VVDNTVPENTFSKAVALPQPIAAAAPSNAFLRAVHVLEPSLEKNF